MADQPWTFGHVQLVDNATARQLINGTDDACACLFRAPHTDTNIISVGFNAGTVNGSPTVTVTIEGVNTSGEPDGLTPLATKASGTVVAGWQWIDFDTGGFNPVAGTMYAAVVTGLNANAGVDNFLCGHTAGATGTAGFPTGMFENAGAWSVQQNGIPTICVRYGTTNLVPLGMFAQAGFDEATNINSGTTPDEVGVKFTPEVDCDCVGFCMWMSHTTAATEMKFELFDSADVAISGANVTIEGEDTQGSGFIMFQTVGWPAVALTAGSVYRLTGTAISGNSMRFFVSTYPDVASRESHYGMGHRTERTNGTGGFTDETLETISLWPLLSTVTPGGGGGGLIPGDWNGGMIG